jgi:hypothetical protein
MTPLPPSPLQEAISCAFSCFHEARDRLDGAAWSAYVAVLVELSQREASRLALGEVLRALREREEDE